MTEMTAYKGKRYKYYARSIVFIPAIGFFVGMWFVPIRLHTLDITVPFSLFIAGLIVASAIVMGLFWMLIILGAWVGDHWNG